MAHLGSSLSRSRPPALDSLSSPIPFPFSSSSPGWIFQILTLPSRLPVAIKWYERPHEGAQDKDVTDDVTDVTGDVSCTGELVWAVFWAWVWDEVVRASEDDELVGCAEPSALVLGNSKPLDSKREGYVTCPGGGRTTPGVSWPLGLLPEVVLEGDGSSVKSVTWEREGVSWTICVLIISAFRDRNNWWG